MSTYKLENAIATTLNKLPMSWTLVLMVISLIFASSITGK